MKSEIGCFCLEIREKMRYEKMLKFGEKIWNFFEKRCRVILSGRKKYIILHRLAGEEYLACGNFRGVAQSG